jgi:protein dithiol oxidoreductase (disulfide-forming)
MRVFKSIGKWVVVAAFALFGVATQAQAQLAAGKDYQSITPPQPTPPGKNVEVIEFFWYGCPHCAQLQLSLHEWLKRKPADVAFRSQPAAFDDAWLQLARTYYAIDAAGENDKLHSAVFEAIHKTKKLDPRGLSKDPKQLLEWVATQKVDQKKFTDAYNSFSVVSKTQRTVDTTSAYGISSTPTLAVDGRYLIAPSMTLRPDNSVDYARFFNNLDQLIAMARASRKGK